LLVGGVVFVVVVVVVVVVCCCYACVVLLMTVLITKNDCLLNTDVLPPKMAAIHIPEPPCLAWAGLT